MGSLVEWIELENLLSIVEADEVAEQLRPGGEPLVTVGTLDLANLDELDLGAFFHSRFLDEALFGSRIGYRSNLALWKDLQVVNSLNSGVVQNVREIRSWTFSLRLGWGHLALIA